MEVAEWTLLLTAIATPTALATLAVVVRSELQARRRWPVVMWTLRDVGTRNSGDASHSMLELVQFGGTPVRLLHYWTVGFRIKPEEGAYMRSDIRGEDRIRLFVDMLERDSAWMLLAYYSRDDSRWLRFTWVAVEPMGRALRDDFDTRFDRWEKSERRNVRYRCRRAWFRLAPVSVVVPVGPSGEIGARLKVRGKHEPSTYERITSLAQAADPDGGIFTVH